MLTSGYDGGRWCGKENRRDRGAREGPFRLRPRWLFAWAMQRYHTCAIGARGRMDSKSSPIRRNLIGTVAVSDADCDQQNKQRPALYIQRQGDVGQTETVQRE